VSIRNSGQATGLPQLVSNFPPNMTLESALCPVCDVDDCTPIAVGNDFEYQTSDEEFLAVECRRCNMVYLNPRPDSDSIGDAYPDTYHAFHFDPKSFGIVYRIRERLESRRLLKWCKGLADDASILDVGCGDGFHLELLKKYGKPSWNLLGVDSDERAAVGAKQRGLSDQIKIGSLLELNLPSNAFDMIFMIMTVEHLSDPLSMLEEVTRLLRSRGRLIIVTDNTGSPDFTAFSNRHWGGYHFPRHLYLFNKQNLGKLCAKAGLSTVKVTTAVSPVNWTYSFRNWIQDWRGPKWLRDRFSLNSPIALAAFTLLDNPLSWVGRGAILHGVFEKPSST
jgi:ubiquinone/menaquinone biosynthesis C-methylase UbiE